MFIPHCLVVWYNLSFKSTQTLNILIDFDILVIIYLRKVLGFKMWMFYSVNNLSFGLFYDIWRYHLRLSADHSIFLNKNISGIHIWNWLCNFQDDNGCGNILTLVIVQVFQSNFSITILPIFEPWIETQKVDAAIDDMKMWSIHLVARGQVYVMYKKNIQD